MDLNSSSDEQEEDTPPQAAPAQAPSDPAGGATTESMDAANDEVLEVEVEAVWEENEEEEQLDPRTLGVPGLKTLIPGDRVEVLWRHGADSIPMLALTAAPIDSRHTARGRAGWERGRVKECLLEMRAGRPVIIYHLAYDDGEKANPRAAPAPLG